MIEHIKSIRNWHYVLVILAVAGLSLVIDQSRSTRRRELITAYLDLKDQPQLFSNNTIYSDSVDAVILARCTVDTLCPGLNEVREFMKSYYLREINLALEDTNTSLPRASWMVDSASSNERLLRFAHASEELELDYTPLVKPFADTIFNRLQHWASKYPLVLCGIDVWEGPERNSMNLRSGPKGDILSSFQAFGWGTVNGVMIVVDSGKVWLPYTVPVIEDSLYFQTPGRGRMRLLELMTALRHSALWRDIKDLNYSESASLLQEKLDNDAIALPIVGLSVQKGTAVLIFMAASLLVALFLHLNLASANGLYRYPDRVEDLGAAFTSAYIGTSTTWVAKGINYILLVALPVFIMVMLIRYSYASGSGLFTAAMGLVSVAYAWTAHRNALLMSALARNAQEHWHKEPQGTTRLPVKEHLGDEED